MEEFEQTKKCYSPENEVVVNKNLEKIKAEMFVVLANESMGSNANVMEIDKEMYSAQAVNGYINNKTGEIIIFSNEQHIAKELKEGNTCFTLKVAGKFKPGIVPKQNYFFQAQLVSSEGLSDYARTVLNETIDQWNLNQKNKPIKPNNH